MVVLVVLVLLVLVLMHIQLLLHWLQLRHLLREESEVCRRHGRADAPEIALLDPNKIFHIKAGFLECLGVHMQANRPQIVGRWRCQFLPDPGQPLIQRFPTASWRRHRPRLRRHKAGAAYSTKSSRGVLL